MQAFPDFKDEESEEEEEEDIEEEEIFYIFDTVKDLFDIYNICLSYVVNEFNSLDSTVLIALIKDKGLNITDSLSKIPYIHSGFLNIINSKAKSNGK